jgi:hypothetical protein
MRRSPFKCLLLVSLLFIAHAFSAQQRPIASPYAPANLPEVTARAGIILVGRVISIKPMLAVSSEPVGSVQITFQVEQGIRGCRAGEQFSFREWAGLWSDVDRYRLGQRIMLFLYTPGTLGLTSPVGGPAGRFPIDASGGMLLTPAQQQSIQISQTPNIRGLRVPVGSVVRAIRGMSKE